MNQDQVFRDKIKQVLAEKLPGWEAHLKLAPIERIEGIREHNVAFNPKASAVLIILFRENNQIKVLFILRSVYDGAHSGQISFPGGQRDESDRSLTETALRETQEEVGIKIEEENVLGKLSNLYIPPSNFIVEPFVAFIDKLDKLTPDATEVQQIYKIALDELLDENTIQLQEVLSRNNQTISAPCFYIDNLKIWGATAMILNELLTVIKSIDLRKIDV